MKNENKSNNKKYISLLLFNIENFIFCQKTYLEKLSLYYIYLHYIMLQKFTLYFREVPST